MNTKTKKTAGIVAGATALIVILAAISPLGGFLQSSLLSTPYAKQDAGLYLGMEQTTTEGKVLTAKQGVSLRSDTADSNGKKLLNVYIAAHTDTTAKADRVDGVMTYDATKLSATSIGDALKTVSANISVDSSFSTVMKDSAGKETGTLYFAMEKGSDFTSPKEDVAKVVFTLADNVEFADVTVDTLKMYKKADLYDTAKSTLYLTKAQGGDTVYQKLIATNQGTTVGTNEASTTSGGKVRTDVFKDADGKVIKTIVTTYDDKGRIITILSTYADGSKDLTTYVYAADGSYTETIVTTDKDGKATTVVKSYDKDGKLKTNQTATSDVAAAQSLTSDDGKFKMVLPAGGTVGVKSFNIQQVSTATGYDEVKKTLLPLGNVYSLEFRDVEDKMVSGTTQPMTLTFLHDAASLPAAPSGKTLSEISPCMLDRASGEWIRLPRSSQTSPITITSTSATSYMLAVAILGSGDTVHTVTTTTTEGTEVCTPAEPFTDTDGHWGESYINAARTKCIVGGKFAGRFFPNEAVTRAELTKMATTAFEVTAPASAAGTQFVDVRSGDWFASVVALASKAGVINGYADSTFKPNNNINRAEALKIILEAYQKSGNTSDDFEANFAAWRAQFPTYSYVQFEDTFIGDWFAKYVYYAWANDIVEGYSEGGLKQFKAGQDITRAEVVKILMEMSK